MKIAFLIGSLKVGGAERQLSLLARELRKRQHEVVVLVYYDGGIFFEELTAAGVRCISLGKKRRWNPFFLIKLIQSIKRESPDLIFSYLMGPSSVVSLFSPLFRKIPIVWGMRNSKLDFNKHHWLEKISVKFGAKLSNVPRLMIANSFSGQEFYVNLGYDKSKMRVVHNGIETDMFKPDLKLGILLRKEWNIKDDELLLGMIARIDPTKCHDMFLRMAKYLITKNNKLKFVCVGQGDEIEFKKLQELTKSLELEDHLRWGGLRTDMVAVYNSLDLNILPATTGEGFSNVIAEGMSCGIVSVGMPVSDIPLIIEDKRLLAVDESLDELTKAVEYGMDICRDRDVKSKMRQSILKKFSVEAMVDKTENLLYSVVKAVQS